jgi:hypothetical protein
MSALEDLWLWLQGRSSRTEAGPDTLDAATDNLQSADATPDPAVAARKAELEARVQRHARYRGGPWQMK